MYIYNGTCITNNRISIANNTIIQHVCIISVWCDFTTSAARGEYYAILGTLTTLYHLYTLALYKRKLLTSVLVISV